MVGLYSNLSQYWGLFSKKITLHVRFTRKSNRLLIELATLFKVLVKCLSNASSIERANLTESLSRVDTLFRYKVMPIQSPESEQWLKSDLKIVLELISMQIRYS